MEKSILQAAGREIKAVRLVKTDYLVSFSDGTSQLVPRVTSVLGILAKPALVFWSANVERQLCLDTAEELYGMGAFRTPAIFRLRLEETLGEKKAHQKQSRKALDIGLETHALIQHDLKGRLGRFDPQPEASGAAHLAFMAWEDWRYDVGFEPVSAETPLGSDLLGVGGTNDAAGWMGPRPGSFAIVTDPIQPIEPGRFIVCDWKSSKRSKTAPDGIYYESLVQVSVYRRMGIDMGLFPEDSLAAVVRLPKDLEDPVIKEKQPVDVRILEPKEADDYVEDFKTFRAAWARLAMRGQV